MISHHADLIRCPLPFPSSLPQPHPKMSFSLDKVAIWNTRSLLNFPFEGKRGLLRSIHLTPDVRPARLAAGNKKMNKAWTLFPELRSCEGGRHLKNI